MGPVELFLICLLTGLTLVGMEIFVPGGILGTIGAMALVGAIVTGFIAFPGFGVYIALGIILLLALVIILWIKFFPRTSIGRQMTVSKDLGAFKATEEGMEALVDKEGVASSDLRPAGFALIDGRRVDVVTQGSMITRGERVRVLRVEGNHVIVGKIEAL